MARELRDEVDKINSKMYKQHKKEDNKNYNRISDLLLGDIYNRLERIRLNSKDID